MELQNYCTGCIGQRFHKKADLGIQFWNCKTIAMAASDKDFIRKSTLEFNFGIAKLLQWLHLTKISKESRPWNSTLELQNYCTGCIGQRFHENVDLGIQFWNCKTIALAASDKDFIRKSTLEFNFGIAELLHMLHRTKIP